MRRTRRQGPRVVWLPPDTDESTGIEGAGFRSFAISVTAAVPFDEVSIPLTIDMPADPATATLSDVENSGYRLRRIVGKIFAMGDRFDDESGIEAVSITAGFMVRRVGTDGTPIATETQRSPAHAENWGDPWIWRRSWLLFNPELAIPFSERLPLNNFDYHSAVDGAHVDQKTARIVGPEERLFLDISALALFRGGQAEISNDTIIVTDLRILGSMRTSVGNRRNANR